MKLKNIILLITAEIFSLISIVFLIAAILLLPVYIYQNGGWDAIGLLFMLVGWTLFCWAIIVKK